MKRPFSIRRMMTFAGLSLLAGLTAWLAVRGADTPEAREIKAGLKRQAQRIKSLEVTYKLETTSPLKPEQLVAIPRFRNQVFLPKDEWHTAFKGDKRYHRQIILGKVEFLQPSDENGLFKPEPVQPQGVRLHAEGTEEDDRAVRACHRQHEGG